MSYHVSISGFEGPFDLLLQLVSQRRVDVGTMSLSSIAAQFLDEASRVGDADLEVASDFAYVASALLELKAAALIEDDRAALVTDLEEEDFEELTASELMDVLTGRLLAYRTYKNVSEYLDTLFEARASRHERTQGAPQTFYEGFASNQEDIRLEELAATFVELIRASQRLLLQSAHIERKRISLEEKVALLAARINRQSTTTFDELIGQDSSIENRVVSLLAILELEKRNMIELSQDELFSTIYVKCLDEEEERLTVPDSEEEGE